MQVESACCHFYTETNYLGELFQVCADAYDKEGFMDVPEKFFKDGIKSWTCGENSLLLLEEVEERNYCSEDNQEDCVDNREGNSFTSQAWTDNSVIYNSDLTTSEGQIVDGAKSSNNKITSVYVKDLFELEESDLINHIETTLFEQDNCTGRTWGLNYHTEAEENGLWKDEVMNHLGVSLVDSLKFHSVLLKPDSKLTIITENNQKYHLINHKESTNGEKCFELPTVKNNDRIMGYRMENL